MENGSLDLWDAAKLEAGASDALISQTVKHSGAIKAVRFNPLRPQVLATAGAKGEVFVFDVNDMANPLRLGNPAARSDDIECLAFNQKVPHIFATGSTGGLVTVWDLKSKKASLTLNNNRKAVSSIAWDPNNSTRLLTGTSDDATPLIYVWDLRNSSAPEKTLQGHEAGVLSVSWCRQDRDLLLSSGKDNKTIVWNPLTGEKLGELPEVTNWTFLTRFNDQNPNLSATASFDGKIAIQTLQNANPDTSQATANENLDDEDFFRAAPIQTPVASWSLAQAPQWFKRPTNVSFGFGGKVIIVRPTPGADKSSQIVIEQFSADSDVSSATEKFQAAVASGDVTSICDQRIEQSKTEEEKADWKVIQTLAEDNPRPKIIEYLGFSTEDLTNGSASEETAKATTKDTEENSEEKSKGFSFDNGDDDDDDFLSNLPASKGAKTDEPFHLFSEKDTAADKSITEALMLGNFAKATDICLKEERIADAFLIANCGGQDLVEKVQTTYLAQKKDGPSYMRLLGSVIEKNLWDVVYNADLQNWKEAMSIICTFSDPNEFPDLCEALGDRIHESGERKDASFCYLVGSKLEKVVSIWTSELEESEEASIRQASDDSTFSVHARHLQNFIEKVTIFRQVTKFVDSDQDATSNWKLSALYDKYTEYADILAGHGQLEVAQKYLDLIPSTYPPAETAKARVKLATQKPAAAKKTLRQPDNTNLSRNQTPYGFQPTQPAVGAPANPYGPGPNVPQPQPSFMQPPQSTGNPYQPHGAYAPPQNMYQPPGQVGYTTPAPPPIGGPPPASAPSAPPKKRDATENWNDVPMVTKAPPPRRSTPRTVTPAFSANPTPPPPGPGQYGQYGQPANPSPPPPPKGPAPPRVQSPLTGPPQTSQIQVPPRPSSAANQYAPPPPQPGAIPPSMTNVVPRTASPYNAPPAGAPPSNRYAPAPSAQPQHNAPPPGGPLPRPTATAGSPAPVNPYGQLAQQTSPPPNPYAPPASYGAPQQGNYGAPPPAAQVQPSAPPPGGPPRGSAPPMGRPGAAPASTPTPPPPKAAAAPSKARHPPGDRSHIPANAQRLVGVLTEEMQRVVAKAPANFAPQVKDTQKRLNILFDHLNNEELVKPDTIDQISQIADAIQSRDYDTASRIQVEIQRDKTEECGNWVVGVKRLIAMSKATP